jgi:tRNA G46 methylase TrmB
LSGTYESELHPALSEAIGRKPEVVVNIGAAEGFYVSAIARKLPSSKFIAFEAMDSWHSHLHRNLKINGVENRCDLRGFCSLNDFENLISELGSQSSFVLMDIEGGEFDLITHSIIWVAD